MLSLFFFEKFMQNSKKRLLRYFLNADISIFVYIRTKNIYYAVKLLENSI